MTDQLRAEEADERVADRRDRERVVRPGLRVAHAKLDGAEGGPGPHLPPQMRAIGERLGPPPDTGAPS